jgi:hypothetical protein
MCSFNSGYISEHIIKVLMPIESVRFVKIYGEYDGFTQKK